MRWNRRPEPEAVYNSGKRRGCLVSYWCATTGTPDDAAAGVSRGTICTTWTIERGLVTAGGGASSNLRKDEEKWCDVEST